MTDPASKLAPPTLHWSRIGHEPAICDLCRDPIKPYGDCFLSVRRAFELHQGRMVETEPITVLMCVACGWTRPYAPMPRQMPDSTSKAPNAPQTPNAAPDGPTYHDSGVMD